MAGLKQKQSLSHSLSPQQILQTLILQLNSTSLEQKVIDELESNPLLDQPEFACKLISDVVVVYPEILFML